MRAVISTENMSDEEAVAAAASSPGMVGSDYVREVTTPHPYTWDRDDTLSCEWTLAGPKPLPPIRHRVVAYDFGIKRNILRRLRQHGFGVEVVGARTSADDVLARNPDGVFLSNGPGDPAALDYVHREVRQLVGKKPIFAICLGHQMLGHAFGGRTFKLKFGHRGGNQPVKDLRTGKVAITSQNHGFAVDAQSLPPEIEVTHLNLNDQTVEGLRHREHPVFSVQYHPEAAPGPHDASYFFAEFARLIDEGR
jgi:carbamoyl-phosphate synthase small subunit